MNTLTKNEKEVLTQCINCLDEYCIHKYAYRRVSKDFGGLELCYNIIAAKENKRVFAVVERYYDNGNTEVYICRYTSEKEKVRVLEGYPENSKYYDQYITYELNFEEVREKIVDVQNA